MVPIKILLAIILIESNGDPNAYNPSSGATGLLQVRQCVVSDINRADGADYVLSDFKDPDLAMWAFYRYARLYKARTVQEAVRLWHGGPTGMHRGYTKEYYRRVCQATQQVTL